jgi:hypothetical protein
MIVEKTPDFAKVIEAAEHLELPPYCEHDFPEKVDFGDIALCNKCHRYFVKVKHLIWVIRPQKLHEDLTIPARANHFDAETWVQVPVRVS